MDLESVLDLPQTRGPEWEGPQNKEYTYSLVCGKDYRLGPPLPNPNPNTNPNTTPNPNPNTNPNTNPNHWLNQSGGPKW